MKRLGTVVLAGLIAGFVRFSPPVSAAPLPAQPGRVASAAASSAADASTAVRETLANGMRVVLLPNKLAPVATTLMSYGVGDADDTLPGIAHATEHMLFRGTASLSGGQLADIAARMGADYNALTADESTLYYYKLPVGLRRPGAAHRSRPHDQRRDPRDRLGDRARRDRTGDPRAGEPADLHRSRTTLNANRSLPARRIATASAGTVPSFEKMTADDIRAFYHHLVQARERDPHRRGRHRPGKRPGPASTRTSTRLPAARSPSANRSSRRRWRARRWRAPIDFPVGFGVLAYRLPGSNAADYGAGASARRGAQQRPHRVSPT